MKITNKPFILNSLLHVQGLSNQLILRNIGGVIVIDFIDMGSQKDQFYLLNYFNKFLNKDSNQPKIIQFSE